MSIFVPLKSERYQLVLNAIAIEIHLSESCDYRWPFVAQPVPFYKPLKRFLIDNRNREDG